MKIDFEKSDGLVPVIVQHTNTLQVLMLGYMNKEALEKTETEGKVTFSAEAKVDYGQKVKLLVITLWLKILGQIVIMIQFL